MMDEEQEQRLEKKFRKIKKNLKEGKNVFGLPKPAPTTANCGLFLVCEFAGTKAEGGRCDICGKNRNNKNYVG